MRDASGRSTKVRESEIEAAILDGTFAFPDDQEVSVIDRDGNIGTIPGSQIKTAIQSQGYRLEKSADRAIREYVEENQGLGGQAKVALGQLADEALLGIPETIIDATADPLDVKKKNALKEYHDTANTIGGLTGFGASMVVGGPLWKGGAKAGAMAEKALAAKLAAKGVARGSESIAKDIVARSALNATKLGVEGAVVSTPMALTEAALGDPDQAAESLMAGGGIGVALGLTTGPFAAGLKKLAKKYEAGTAKELFQGLADERAAKAIGFSKGQIKKLKDGQNTAEEIGNYLLNAKIPDAEKGFKPVISATSSIEDILDNVKVLQANAGEALGTVYKQLDDRGLGTVDILSVQKRLQDKIGKDFTGEIFTSERNLLQNFVNDLGAINYKTDINLLNTDPEAYLKAFKAGDVPPVTFEDVRKYMDRISDIAFPKGIMPGEPSPRQAVAKKVWLELRAAVDEGVDAAVAKTGDKTIKSTLAQARKEYSYSKDAERALKDKISSMAGNKLIGLTDTITGVGAAALDPLTIVPSILAKKTFESYGNQVGAKLFQGAADAIFMSEKFMDRVKSRLDEMPEILKGMQDGSKPVATSAGKSISAIQRLIKSEDSDEDATFAEVQDAVVKAVSNVEQSVSKLSEDLAPISTGGAPQVSQALSNKMVSTVKYIYDAMPKQAEVQNPFNRYEYSPSDAELASFTRKLSVVLDPFAALDALKDDSLTKDHVEALAYVYPAIYKNLGKRIFDYASESPKGFPYQSRLKLSLLLGINFDSSVTQQSLATLQSSYAGPQAAATESTGLNTGAMKSFKPGQAYLTESQRLQAKT